MEPGTFKDRVLVNTNPHLVIEGIILAAYAVSADQGIMFIRPSYEMDAQLLERELQVAREAGFLGKKSWAVIFLLIWPCIAAAAAISAGKASAQVNAIMGKRAHPNKEAHMTDTGVWGKPTIVNNVETLACVPHIIQRGPQWFKGLARTKNGAGTMLYCISGRVNRPGCYEFPVGTPLREIIDEAGGMSPGESSQGLSAGWRLHQLYARQIYRCADG